MKKLFLLILSVILLFSSCSSIETMLGREEINAPGWYPNGRNVRGAISFVGMGSGISESAARDAAYNSLLQEVSDYLGYDVVGRYYREFSENGAVTEISLETDAVSSSFVSGTFYYYILAFAEEDIISTRISEERRALVESEMEVERLRSVALNYYRQNNDVEAINALLEAIPISVRASLEEGEGNSAGELLETATGYLSNIEIRLSRERPQDGTVTVRVIRNRGWLSPPVVGASINATLTIRNHRNETELFIVPYETGSNGRFSFSQPYPPMTQTGSVVFSLNIDAAVDAAIQATGEDFFADFLALAESKSVSYDYSIQGRMYGDEVLVIGSERAEDGSLLPTTYVRDSLSSYLEGEGLTTVPSSLDINEEEEDVVSLLMDLYSQDYRWIIWCSAYLAPVSLQPANGDTVYVADGYTLLIDTSTGTVVYRDEYTRTVSWGNDRATALAEVFSAYGSAAAYTLSPYF